MITKKSSNIFFKQGHRDNPSGRWDTKGSKPGRLVALPGTLKLLRVILFYLEVKIVSFTKNVISFIYIQQFLNRFYGQFEINVFNDVLRKMRNKSFVIAHKKLIKLYIISYFYKNASRR